MQLTPASADGLLGELHTVERVVLDIADVVVLDVDTNVPLGGELGDLAREGVPGGRGRPRSSRRAGL
jgi:hypothetical protein